MRKWHSLYEIFKFPLQMTVFAILLCGIGSFMTNTTYGFAALNDSQILITAGSVLQKAGSFIWVNFPVFFMINAVNKRGGSAITVISVLSGYVAFLVTTMLVAPGNLVTTAYSSVLGLSSTTTSAFAASVTRYPLQTGLVGPLLISFITLFMYGISRKKSEYGFFSFISREMICVTGTVILSVLAGILISYVWPFFILAVQKIVSFISADTTNPVNMALYGITDRILTILNMNALLRQPFWYTIQGGSWMSLTGSSIVGDVNIWTNQVASLSVTSLTGRFITPYYILNMFAVPGMLIAVYTVCTEPIGKRKYRGMLIMMGMISLLTGSLLPLELTMLLLCPFLLVLHIGLSGLLFAVLQSMHIYLGYNSTGNYMITALPGTLPEFLSYLSNPSLRGTMLMVVIAGIITGVVYFIVTKLYFSRFAVDLFKTGDLERNTALVIKGVGGLDNIKKIYSDFDVLTVILYDSTKLKSSRFKQLGVIRILDTRAGYRIPLGAGSTMIKNEIEKQIRSEIR